MNEQIRVLLVDDHVMLRKGVAALLGAEPDISVVGEAGDGEQAIALARALKPDVAVMDISMPGLSGVDATRQILAESPGSKIIALSIHAAKRFVDDMLDAGAAGYLLKESAPEELVQGIRAVMRGEMVLSSAITATVVTAYVQGMDDARGHNDADAGTDILQTKLDALEQRFILVLDDYHLIHAGSVVNELIDQLLISPPLPLHLVIITRRDPPIRLGTLRARGQVNELRMEDLRFSREDTRSLLQQHMNVRLSEDVLARLEQEVEGWAVGLRMLTVALSKVADQQKFLTEISCGDVQIRDYLIHEVIAGQPPALQDWLRRSDILDRFVDLYQ